MRHFRNFIKTDALSPEQKALAENCSIQFIQDETGADWYALQRLFKSDTLKIQYDKTGLITAADADVSKLFPVGCSVIEYDGGAMPEKFKPGEFTFIDGNITPVEVDYLAIAAAERDRRMNAVSDRINRLVEAQEDDDITPTEAAELAALKAFRVSLRRIDLSAAPEITWPEVSDYVA